MSYNPSGSKLWRRLKPPVYSPINTERSPSPRPKVATTVTPPR